MFLVWFIFYFSEFGLVFYNLYFRCLQPDSSVRQHFIRLDYERLISNGIALLNVARQGVDMHNIGLSMHDKALASKTKLKRARLGLKEYAEA